MIYEFVGKLDTERNIYLITDSAGSKPILFITGRDECGKRGARAIGCIQRHLVTVIECNVVHARLVCRVVQMADRGESRKTGVFALKQATPGQMNMPSYGFFPNTETSECAG